MTTIHVIYCEHGLDLRLHPRCFLCKPLEWPETNAPVPGYVQPDGYFVIRPYVGPMQSGGTTATPWCGICQGWHIPGAGPCTATYSLGAQQS